ncbi:kinase-like protein [Artomyces pyxidatus]|uniref:Kinase-like protein n=1 Tax=Artomyces pyxidatus TaxID=48021 RepID=A0ACB8THM8_9AGAM|nr:kinase-like protein [Artomyces pyxidatus]
MYPNDRISEPFIGAVEDEWQLFSDRSEDYTLGPPIGFGASSTVYSAVFQPKGCSAPPVPCALKVLDLDRLPQGSLRLLERETQLMSLSKHPNVLRVRGSWMDGHKLYIALRLMNAGSAADVMRYGWPGGMEEEVVRCILKQALQGLNYLHINGFIHRDIKAANLLIDDDGTVLLGDLGVAAQLQDDSEPDSPRDARRPERSIAFDPALVSAPRRARVGKRRSFVGTPCWMAPELISGKHYDSSADIWSFGITALELAQGRAPRSRETPHAVLLQTVQDAPPTLDRDGGVHKYSRAFKEVVEGCLLKDPSRRPTAAQLLQTPFFKNAKKSSHLVSTILTGLPPLAQRLERRPQPSLLLHGTVDSWDFTVASPTVSQRSSLYVPEPAPPSDGDDASASNESASPTSSPAPATPQRSRSPSPQPAQRKLAPPPSLCAVEPESTTPSLWRKLTGPRRRESFMGGVLRMGKGSAA